MYNQVYKTDKSEDMTENRSDTYIYRIRVVTFDNIPDFTLFMECIKLSTYQCQLLCRYGQWICMYISD